MDHGQIVPNHVEKDKKLVQEQKPYLLQTEVNHVKERRRKYNLVIRMHAQSTVNGALMKHGPIALNHVEEDKKVVQDLKPYRHLTEVNLVKGKLRKNNLVVRKHAQLTVNGVPMENGQTVPNHVAEDKKLVLDQKR